MATAVKKSLLGVQDIHFDAAGTGATAQTPCSDGLTTRTVHKLNASHIPLSLESRAALGNSVYLDAALAYVIEQLSTAAGDASTTQKGLIEIATPAEVLAGIDPLKAVTPQGLVARTATDSRLGLIQLATEAEVLAGADTTKAVTPATLAPSIAAAIAISAGMIIAFPAETVPDGYLECNGASLSRTTYATLFAQIGTRRGFADAGHFNIPDYRGFFLRGWSHNQEGNDPNKATRLDRGDGTTGNNVGTVQYDAIRNITGSWAGSVQNDWTNTYTGALYKKVNASVSVDRGDIGTANNALGFDASLVVPTANENRPINVYVMYCIKY